MAITLAARWLTVGLPVALARRAFRLPEGAAGVLTWGGLRGGISIALALSIPAGPWRETLIALTYCVVAFSILVQGLTFSRLVTPPCAAMPERHTDHCRETGQLFELVAGPARMRKSWFPEKDEVRPWT